MSPIGRLRSHFRISAQGEYKLRMLGSMGTLAKAGATDKYMTLVYAEAKARLGEADCPERAIEIDR